MEQLLTPDGRYLVVRGRLWRAGSGMDLRTSDIDPARVTDGERRALIVI